MATRAILPENASPTDSVVAAALLRHYDINARALPWRVPPGSDNRADPFAVWLSEIMLQQTTVAAASPYFSRFMARWPTVAALAAAADADVMAAWAGLGYYARARNLLACARTVVRDHGGRFPDTEDALRALPGIGAYTAAAIAAIAFGQRAVVVDGNVERVVARLAAVETPLPAAKREIRRIADALTPSERAGDYAQAMMDLGATICTPRTPKCGACPVARHCVAMASGDPVRYPARTARKARPEHRGHVWWIERDGHVLIVTRPECGLLGGMRALPGSAWSADPPAAPPFTGQWQTCADEARHVFTHFSLTLSIQRLTIKDDVAPLFTAAAWWSIGSLGDAGLPSVFAKAAAIALAERAR